MHYNKLLFFLPIAAKEGHYEIVKLLLRNSQDVVTIYRGRTALEWASERGHDKIVQLLLLGHAREDDACPLWKYNDSVVSVWYCNLHGYFVNLRRKLLHPQFETQFLNTIQETMENYESEFTNSGTALKRCKSANCTVNLRTFIGKRVLTQLLAGMKRMQEILLPRLKM